MIPKERRDQILALLENHGYMTVEQLAENIYVSVPTIRRDLNALAKEGSVRRVHGGASHINTEYLEWPFDQRNRVHLEEKRRIGKIAAQMVEDGDHIFIDSGSTCYSMVRYLDPGLKITALTNCIPTLQELSKKSKITVECPCGEYISSLVSVTGTESAEYIKTRHARIYFASVSGIDAEVGFSDRTNLVTPIKQAMQKSADKTYLLLDHSKVFQKNYYRVFDFCDVDGIVTDRKLPLQIEEKCIENKVKIILAP